MSVSSISSTSIYAEWRILMQQSSSSSTNSASNDGDADDGAAIGQQGFAALLQGAAPSPSQAGGGITDARAAEIGARIQAKDPTLFQKLDANGDGTLSAQELKDGRDQLRAANAARIGQAIDQSNPALFKALDSNGDGTLSAQELKAGRQLLAGVDPTATSASTGAATSGTTAATGAAPAEPTHHHRHHHHGGGQPPAGTSAASPIDPSGTAGSSSTDQMSAQANLQMNAIADILQQWFNGNSSST